jgi:kynureninase
MRVGTPPVMQMAALEAALDASGTVSTWPISARARSSCPSGSSRRSRPAARTWNWPARATRRRGSQVSFRFDDGYAAMQALIARGVIGDFRAPDIMRFGFAERLHPFSPQAWAILRVSVLAVPDDRIRAWQIATTR